MAHQWEGRERDPFSVDREMVPTESVSWVRGRGREKIRGEKWPEWGDHVWLTPSPSSHWLFFVLEAAWWERHARAVGHRSAVSSSRGFVHKRRVLWRLCRHIARPWPSKHTQQFGFNHLKQSTMTLMKIMVTRTWVDMWTIFPTGFSWHLVQLCNCTIIGVVFAEGFF